MEWVRVGLASFEESLLSEVYAVRNHPSGCQEKEGNAREKVKHVRIVAFYFNVLNKITSKYTFSDVLRLVTCSSPRTWGGTRDKPKNGCVGG